jgi:hypothetical protein
MNSPSHTCAGHQGGPQAGIGAGRGFAGMQQTRVLSQYFIRAVAGVLQEGLVHVFDAGIHIGNDDAGRALLDHQRKLLQLLLAAEQFGGAFFDFGFQLLLVGLQIC